MPINSLPKPTRADRQRKSLDYTRLALAKDPPDRVEAYLEYIRGMVCCAWSTECGGVTEAAHLAVEGKGIKASDYFTVPLCTKHHALQHAVGIETFQANEGVNLWAFAAKCLVQWIRRMR